jgi:pimeloyl-ACP methyl ester carboxylesterase
MKFALFGFLFVFAPILLIAEWKKEIIHQLPLGRGNINGVVANDFDRDGKIEVMASFNGGVTLFGGKELDIKKEVANFKEVYSGKRKMGTSCIHACLMDVDGDGDMDFIGSNQLVFWLECPDQPFSKKWIFRVIDEEILGTHCVTTGDINQDGKTDLIANSGKGENTPLPHSIVWLESPVKDKINQPWTRHIIADRDAPGGSHYMGVGDVNGDGLPDIACGAKGGEKFPGGEWFAWWEQTKERKSPWLKHTLSSKQPGASNILPADLDGDKHVDYFASRGHANGILWFKGPKFNKAIVIDSVFKNPHSLALADLDRDGDLDGVTCGSQLTGQVVWYENNGKAKFTKHLIGKNQSSYDLRAVDMDGDQDLDILIAGHHSSNIVWYKNPAIIKANPFPVKETEWKGFACEEFKISNSLCRVVIPTKTAPGKPWIIRARFWGHQPQADLALLEKGWHLTYCDVGNLFGAPKAVKRWDEFYKIIVQEYGLAKKVALEGMSRGGLIIYNWAKKNPQKTLCIYADAPVCDFKSWPGGKGLGKGSQGAWQTCIKAYGIEEEEALQFKGLPIYGLENLVKAKVPLLHVVGQADRVVPVEENTDIIEKKIKALGGEIRIIRKEGVDHHPHSLSDPEPIVSFILKAWDSLL